MEGDEVHIYPPAAFIVKQFIAESISEVSDAAEVFDFSLGEVSLASLMTLLPSGTFATVAYV